MKWMRKDEFLPLAPEYVGKIRVNHTGDHCSGESLSMVVERNADDSINAKCFRCDARGYWNSVKHYRDTTEREKRTRHDDRSIFGYVPYLSHDSHEWSKQARRWLAEAGLTTVIAEQRGFGWEESEQKLWIPVVQEGLSAYGDVDVGHILRGFTPKSYLTRTVDKTGFYGLYRGPESDTVVLVEDVLSALRVAEHTDALALLGTSLLPRAFNTIITEQYSNAIVFLDGDNPTVRRNARKIARSLPIDTRLIETGRDPKSYTPTELEELLK